LKRNNQAVTLKLVQFKGSKNQLLYWQAETFLSVLRLLALSSLIVAMARRTVDISNQTKTTKGIDIVMAVDVSEYVGKDLKP
jgi:Ca-activated chloride channel family protein